LYDVVYFQLLCKEYLTLVYKNFPMLFSAVISEHFSINYMIISVVAAKIWYLKNVRFLLGHPVSMFNSMFNNFFNHTHNFINHTPLPLFEETVQQRPSLSQYYIISISH